ncbi:MAG: adenylate/guanylate cyclase domain-containing protein [Acetobacteraceae bacterium]
MDSDRLLVAVLVTDIVDSTKRAADLGDHDWCNLLGRHDVVTRSEIRRFGGKEVGNRGDGFVVIFDSPSRAVRCALAISEALAPFGLMLRSGVHAGEVYLRDGGIDGIAVHVAARIAAAACPGEVCVSGTVRDLMAGSRLALANRGAHRFRGLPEDIHLYVIAGPATEGDPCVVGLEGRRSARKGMVSTQLQRPIHCASPLQVSRDNGS